MRFVVAHCRTNFLPITETFIESQIKNLGLFDSIILTRGVSKRFDEGSGDFEIFAKKSKFSLKWAIRRMSLEEKRFFASILKEKNARMLHAHFGLDAWYFLPLKKKMGLPLAVSFYGYDAYQLPAKFFGAGKMLLKSVFKNADLIIVPSEHMKKQLMEAGCQKDKIEILSWGVASHSLSPAGFALRSNGKNSVIKFIHIGRMVEKKGQIYLLEAFQDILTRGIGAELVIIGSGPLKAELLNAIDKLGICDRVKLIDRLSNDAVKEELMSHNVYVQPSIVSRNNDQEGIPTAIMEACACGLPAIASWHSGIPEIIKDGVNGILVPERDSEKLADAMEKLAKNPELRARMGENGRKMVEERFDAKKQAEKLGALYGRLLKI